MGFKVSFYLVFSILSLCTLVQVSAEGKSLRANATLSVRVNPKSEVSTLCKIPKDAMIQARDVTFIKGVPMCKIDVPSDPACKGMGDGVWIEGTLENVIEVDAATEGTAGCLGCSKPGQAPFIGLPINPNTGEPQKIDVTPLAIQISRPIYMTECKDGIPCNCRVGSDYGSRKRPVRGATSFHRGLDIAVQSGVPIFAGSDGIAQVIPSRKSGGYGNRIDIIHTDLLNIGKLKMDANKRLQVPAGQWITINACGIKRPVRVDSVSTTYNHLLRPVIRDGVFVRKGELIGYAGRTGISTGTHLHYEISVQGLECQADGQWGKTTPSHGESEEIELEEEEDITVLDRIREIKRYACDPRYFVELPDSTVTRKPNHYCPRGKK